MIIWVDAQLSPALSPWLATTFSLSARALRDLGLRDANDREIFLAAREAGATIMTKDSDFVRLVENLGPPPQVIWIICGNSSKPEPQTSFGEYIAARVRVPGGGRGAC
jgi:predicted nuclease of predicted toxin-antitoxin system